MARSLQGATLSEVMFAPAWLRETFGLAAARTLFRESSRWPPRTKHICPNSILHTPEETKTEFLRIFDFEAANARLGDTKSSRPVVDAPPIALDSKTVVRTLVWPFRSGGFNRTQTVEIQHTVAERYRVVCA